MLHLIYIVLILQLYDGACENITKGEITNQNVQNLTNQIILVNTTNNTINELPQSNFDIPRKLPHPPDNDLMQSGALLRAFYVILGVTVILLSYIGFRMFRLRKNTKAPVMVKKYGILTNRTDVEMVPLPLSEDEDDDTIFEINNVNR